MHDTNSKSIHQFKLNALKNGTVNFADFKGKKILLVNVASECGLTPQYAQLEELYREFSDKIVVVGCPANNFGAQEPGTDEQIEHFCTTTYGISFPLTTKISVDGSDMHKLYQFVTKKSENGLQDSTVSWNFQKYVFDENGMLTHVFSPTVHPLEEQVLAALNIQL